jgi:hypothetical protein
VHPGDVFYGQPSLPYCFRAHWADCRNSQLVVQRIQRSPKILAARQESPHRLAARENHPVKLFQLCDGSIKRTKILWFTEFNQRKDYGDRTHSREYFGKNFALRRGPGDNDTLAL